MRKAGRRVGRAHELGHDRRGHESKHLRILLFNVKNAQTEAILQALDGLFDLLLLSVHLHLELGGPSAHQARHLRTEGDEPLHHVSQRGDLLAQLVGFLGNVCHWRLFSQTFKDRGSSSGKSARCCHSRRKKNVAANHSNIPKYKGAFRIVRGPERDIACPPPAHMTTAPVTRLNVVVALFAFIIAIAAILIMSGFRSQVATLGSMAVGGVLNGSLPNPTFAFVYENECFPAPNVTWGRDSIIRRDNDTCVPLYVPPDLNPPEGLTCPTGQHVRNVNATVKGDMIGIECEPDPPTPEAEVMTCPAGQIVLNVTVINGTTVHLGCGPPASNIIANGTVYGPLSNLSDTPVDPSIPPGTYVDDINSTHVCFGFLSDGGRRKHNGPCVPWATLTFPINGTYFTGTTNNVTFLPPSTGPQICPPGQQVLNFAVIDDFVFNVTCGTPSSIVNASNITAAGDVFGPIGSLQISTFLIVPGTYRLGIYDVTVIGKGVVTNVVDTGLVQPYCNTSITTSSTIGNTVCQPELLNITTVANCTGGAVLCRVGRDAHGLVTVLQDGPTAVLINDTASGGFFTGSFAGGFSCVSTGVGAGGYGSQSDNFTFNVPTFTVNSCGQLTAASQFSISLLNAPSGTFILVGTADEIGVVTNVTGNTTIVTLYGPQPLNTTSSVLFGTGCFGPDYSPKLSQTLCVTGVVGTSNTATQGFFNVGEVLPRLQLGIFNDTATNVRPFIGWNLALNRTDGLFYPTTPNASGYLITDPANLGLDFYASSTAASTTTPVNAQGTFMMRMASDKVSNWLALHVGPAPASPFADTSNVGLHVHQVGNTFADVPHITQRMTYSGNFLPRSDWVTSDIGDTLFMFESTLDSAGDLRATHGTYHPVWLNYFHGEFSVNEFASAGVNAVVAGRNTMIRVQAGRNEIRSDVYLGDSTTSFAAMSGPGVGHVVVSGVEGSAKPPILEARMVGLNYPQAQFGCRADGTCYLNLDMFVNSSGNYFTASTNPASNGASFRTQSGTLELVLGGLSASPAVYDPNALSAADWTRARTHFKQPVRISDLQTGIADVRLTIGDATTTAAQWAAPDADKGWLIPPFPCRSSHVASLGCAMHGLRRGRLDELLHWRRRHRWLCLAKVEQLAQARAHARGRCQCEHDGHDALGR